jgi:hypothetical protein
VRTAKRGKRVVRLKAGDPFVFGRGAEEAIALGIFGAPSLTVGSELFWGNDRLETALDWSAKSGR